MTNSRKWGTYYIANLLFRTYFKVIINFNNLNIIFIFLYKKSPT